MKATSNEKMQEHLCEMMERLLDDELFQNEEQAKEEIERAKAMSSLVSTSLDMQKVEIMRNQVSLEAVRVLTNVGFGIDQIRQTGLLPSSIENQI